MIKKFLNQAIIWSGTDALISCQLLLFYNLMTLQIMGSDVHGSWAFILSVVYSFTALLHAGFEDFLIFSYRFNNNSFRAVPIITIQAIFIVLLSFVSAFLPYVFQVILEPQFIYFIFIATVSESLRKSFKSILYYSLKFQQASLIELFGTVSNILCLIIFKINSLDLLASVFLFISICQLVFYFLIIKNRLIKDNLEDKSLGKSNSSHALLYLSLNRFFSIASQIPMITQSPNFFTIISCILFGLSAASTAKISSLSSSWISIYLIKIISASTAVFITNKNVNIKNSFPLKYFLLTFIPMFIINFSNYKLLPWNTIFFQLLSCLIDPAVFLLSKYFSQQNKLLKLFLISTSATLFSSLLFYFFYQKFQLDLAIFILLLKSTFLLFLLLLTTLQR